jgi:hypothetical protein
MRRRKREEKTYRHISPAAHGGKAIEGIGDFAGPLGTLQSQDSLGRADINDRGGELVSLVGVAQEDVQGVVSGTGSGLHLGAEVGSAAADDISRLEPLRADIEDGSADVCDSHCAISDYM